MSDSIPFTSTTSKYDVRKKTSAFAKFIVSGCFMEIVMGAGGGTRSGTERMFNDALSHDYVGLIYIDVLPKIWHIWIDFRAYV